MVTKLKEVDAVIVGLGCTGGILAKEPTQARLKVVALQRGANVFPHNGSYNPTGAVGALAYWIVDAIKNRYIKNPGPLVPACVFA